MFTGIVTALGRVSRTEDREKGRRLEIVPLGGRLELEACRSGDSVAVSGCCLTMLEPGPRGFSADLSAETLASTTLGGLAAGDLVNLELALRAGDRLGGHLVSGHVDGCVRLEAREPEGEAERFEFELPGPLAKYVSRKGSVCLDGVSLTVNAVSEGRFSVCIIPHTLKETTLGSLRPGGRVNLEVDMIARYLERLI